MVATTLCVGVIGMYHSGIGGGGFMLVRDKHGRYETIDYRETAPAAASRDMYQHDQNASVLGGLAVAVPGELRGLEYLHRNYGVNHLVERHTPLNWLDNSSGPALEDAGHARCPCCEGWF